MRSLALFMGALGVSINTSDAFHRMTPERLGLWRFLEPVAERATGLLPYWGHETGLHTVVRRYPQTGGWAVFVLNPTNDRQFERLALRDLIGQESAYAFSWGPEGSSPLGKLGEIRVDLPTHGSLLVYLSPTDTPPPADMTLGGAKFRR